MSSEMESRSAMVARMFHEGAQREKGAPAPGPGAGAGAEAGREAAGAESGTGAKSSRPATAIDSPDGGAGGAAVGRVDRGRRPCLLYTSPSPRD